MLKITDKIDSVFLLQLATSSESKDLDEVRIELFMRTDLSRNNLIQRYGKLFPVTFESAKGVGKIHLWYRKLHWISNMRFSRNNIFHIVSLPGNYDKVNIELQWAAGCENVTFKAQWLHDAYLKYKSNLHNEPESCTNIPSMTFRYEFCINYSSSKSYGKKTYLLFKQQFLYEVNFSMIDDGISWSEASNVCTSSGALLPEFASRDELHEVLSIFRLSRYLKPVVAIYIGINKVGKICETKL